MRICFVAHQATMEGAGRFMLDQVDYLHSHDTTIFAILPTEGPLADALRERMVEVRCISYQWWTKEAIGDGQPDYAASVRAAQQIASMLRQWAIDLVYTQTIVIPIGPLAAALAGLPHIWHIHEFSYNPGTVEMALPQPSLARLISLTTNRTFFNSRAVAAEWAGLLPTEQTGLVYNWTSVVADDTPAELQDAVAQRLLNDDGVFVVAMVGSVLRWKRQLDAVEAVAGLLREGENVALLIVGPATDAAYATEVTDAIRRHGAGERIRLVGYTEQPQRVMRGADVTLVCSDREPFGRVTIESMTQGTPVIGTNCGGTPEIIDDGLDGLLFPTGDVPALTMKLRTLIRDEALRKRLAAAAIEKARRFQSADLAMKPVLASLREIVGQHNPSWPLGTLMGAAIPTVTTATSNATSSRGLIMRVLRKILG